VASRNGRKCHSIDLPCRPLRQVFQEHGAPFYLKLSLHGHDRVCLADLAAEDTPAYVSLELVRNEGQALDTLLQLAALGYDDFKIIDQTNQRQLCGAEDNTGRRLLRRLFHLWQHTNLARKREGGNGPSRPSHGDWEFPVGSSGPFGDQTDGSWLNFEQAVHRWQQFLSGRTAHGRPTLSLWHDLHARHGWVARPGSEDRQQNNQSPTLSPVMTE
jgi:hypothetical protein